MTRPALSSEIRSGSVSAYLTFREPGTDIPSAEVEYIIYPVREGAGRYDDVWVINVVDRKPYMIPEDRRRYVLNRIATEQPDVWNDIRVRAYELAREEVG